MNASTPLYYLSRLNENFETFTLFVSSSLHNIPLVTNFVIRSSPSPSLPTPKQFHDNPQELDAKHFLISRESWGSQSGRETHLEKPRNRLMTTRLKIFPIPYVELAILLLHYLPSLSIRRLPSKTLAMYYLLLSGINRHLYFSTIRRAE